ncbi:alpha/beta hydrolase [Trichlorobacter lovleyi]|uniref:alpha/beta fold hydrolase n=1 Tax=Trichlorobacter lovleyi TaxID=313985 RepID=UPI00223FF301|nr:alpha/beta hydrolase [Trichlorobacter lovleyi]QOX78700.1 alpha/beta hydrolase [Trichlorobacter lovleyi]
MPFAGPIWYDECGAGQPVLFVHGWCMSSAVWGLQRDPLAEQCRVIALDLRGHGLSGVPEAGKTGFGGYADDVVSVVEQLDLQDVVAVGWSLGAQALLKAWPDLQERLAGLVLVGATPRFSAAPHFPHGLPPKEAEGMRLKVRRSLKRALDGFHRNLFVEHELDDPVVAQLVAEQLGQVVMPQPAAALAGLEALMEEELMEEAQQVTCPTLLLHGDQDRVCLPAASAWLGQRMQNSQRLLYPGAGHAPFLSRARQFNHDLLHFVGELHGTD